MVCTRPWFEWANAMLVVFVENALGADCEAPAEEHRRQGIKVRGAYGTCSRADIPQKVWSFTRTTALHVDTGGLSG